jgi:hypothetical protein
MRKQTNAVSVKKSRRGRKKSPRGRKKEKVQISVRIDKTILDLTYDHIKASGRRITDMLERGLLLAMREEGMEPMAAPKLRFVVEHMGADLQRHVLRAAALERLVESRELTPLERFVADWYGLAAGQMETWPGYQEAVESLGTPPD